MKKLIILAGLASTALAQQPIALGLPGIHNAFRATERIISGSQPEGNAAFAALAKLGVKTIISVDGARPDVAAAHKAGLRYIHLPIGYDGVPKQRVVELTKAADSPGQVFVHCHHGKHRGPAAVGIICEATFGWSAEQAVAWLRQAGTAPEYPGLYRAAQDFQPVTKEQLAKVGPLPEVAKSTPLVDSMVALDERFDALKAAQKAGWKMRPAEAATLVWEQLRELVRSDDTVNRPEEYRTKLATAVSATSSLCAAFNINSPATDLPALDAAFQKVSQSCTACHTAFRNKRK